MKAKFNNLVPDNSLLQELTEAYNRVIHSGYYIGGPEVEAFEQEWAEYCGAEYCIGVSSGQAALELLLRIHGVGFGDEVIVPSWTAMPTWKAVLNVGAIPKPVDVDPDTFLLEPKSVMNKTGKQTKAIMPVHLYGYRANVNYGGWPVIQDACQAHGLKALGTAAWSFYPTKNLGAYGDGGAITTDNEILATLIRDSKDSSRLDALQAAFLRVKLGRLEEANYVKASHATHYDYLLRKNDNVNKPSLIGLWDDDTASVIHQYVIRSKDRDELKVYLSEKGIETMIHYPVPPHRQLGHDFDLPIADRLAKEVLSLPITCSQSEIEYICEAINAFY